MKKRTTHKQKPKICLVVSKFPQLSETFIASKFLGLAEGGWDVHIVCDASGPENWMLFPQLKQNRMQKRVHQRWRHRPRWLAALLTPFSLVRCLLLNPTGTLHYLRRGWNRFDLDILRRAYLDAEIILLQPDLVHFEFGTLAVDRLYLGELLNCKLVVSFRGYDLNYSGLENPGYYNQVWDKANGLHFLSKALWQRARERGCPTNKKHSLIHPAIDVEFFSPSNDKKPPQILGTQENPLRILSVGRLEWEKGYEFALQAVKLLQDYRIYCQYHIIGGGDYLEALTFARRQLGLDGVVKFLGAQPHSDVQHQMNWADVFLHPAVSEGFGNAVLEAQAMQLPVVCSDAGGLSENVSHGLTGFVVPRRNPQHLADKVAFLAVNPTLRLKMGQAGRERVQEYFSRKRLLQDFFNFYTNILHNNN